MPREPGAPVPPPDLPAKPPMRPAERPAERPYETPDVPGEPRETRPGDDPQEMPTF